MRAALRSMRPFLPYLRGIVPILAYSFPYLVSIRCPSHEPPITRKPMKKTSMRILAGMSLAIASAAAPAQTSAPQTEPVTVENYNRVQTDIYYAGIAKNGGFGQFRHGR